MNNAAKMMKKELGGPSKNTVKIVSSESFVEFTFLNTTKIFFCENKFSLMATYVKENNFQELSNFRNKRNIAVFKQIYAYVSNHTVT